MEGSHPGTRADGRRNRERLLQAGAEVMSELGAQASASLIARHAGLSRGTFFRHFATKDDLVSAIMAGHYERLRALAEDAEASALWPRAALESYMEGAAAQIAPDRSFFQAVQLAGAEARASAQGLDDAVGRLLARAQAAGVVRRDLVARDIRTLVEAVTSAAAAAGGVRPGLWRRYLGLALDGLGPEVARELSGPVLEPRGR